MITDSVIDYSSTSDPKINSLLAARNDIAALQERHGIALDSLKLIAPFLSQHMGSFVFIFDDTNLGVRTKNNFAGELSALISEKCDANTSVISLKFFRDEIERGNRLYQDNFLNKALLLSNVNDQIPLENQFGSAPTISPALVGGKRFDSQSFGRV